MRSEDARDIERHRRKLAAVCAACFFGKRKAVEVSLLPRPSTKRVESGQDGRVSTLYSRQQQLHAMNHRRATGKWKTRCGDNASNRSRWLRSLPGVRVGSLKAA